LDGEPRNPNSKETALKDITKYARVLGISLDSLLNAAQPLLAGTVDADAFVASLRSPKKPREPKGPTKEARAIELLRRPEGATIAQLMDTFGWQQHSARGFLANLKTRKGLAVSSEKSEGVRTYHLA
jgi:hypothetical protein